MTFPRYLPSPPEGEVLRPSVFSSQSAGSRGHNPTFLHSAGRQEVSAVMCRHFLYISAIKYPGDKTKTFLDVILIGSDFHFVKNTPTGIPLICYWSRRGLITITSNNNYSFSKKKCKRSMIFQSKISEHSTPTAEVQHLLSHWVGADARKFTGFHSSARCKDRWDPSKQQQHRGTPRSCSAAVTLF